MRQNREFARRRHYQLVYQHELMSYFEDRTDDQYFIDSEGEASDETTLCKTKKGTILRNSAVYDKTGKLRLVVMPPDVKIFAKLCNHSTDE
ncbi:hypothetical protein K1T71_005762 [Dendrolimus kikuchii]|uniref:Uncharacterized protein n=1 Tax=Dendrolimus kikuchii TaxID=765133 RepID=A0ACC1D6F6_9NEOP|nr:hypothetical protein K1T71_005762 [Dendrolimus kikuchii]